MKILLPDNLHLSAAASVQRYHLTPEFYRLGYDPEFETFVPISPEDMSHVLDKRDDVGAVLIVDPCYGGASGHLSRVIRAIREHDENIIVVVDAAWGSHFIHLKDGPRPASTCGADLVLHSLHKTGGGRQSTALLMWDEDRIDTATMMATYRDLATPSPNYPLLNNIANVVEYTYSKGRRSVANVVRKAERLRKLVSTEIPAARILDSKWALNRREHVAGVDPIATTIAYTQFKVIGYQIGRRLNGGGFVTEKDGLNSSLFMATFQLPKLAPDWTSAALEKILGKAFRADGKWLGQPHINHLVHRDLLATWTFPFAAFEEVPIERAIGRRLGENLVVYPPGVPIRIKGEILDSSTCSYLQHVHSVGGHIATADETFTTVKVLKEDRSIWSK